MKTDESEQQQAERLRRQLRAGEGELDELTAARLKAARLRAVESVGKRQSRHTAWWSAGGFATAAVALLAVMLVQVGEDMPVGEVSADDWELLAEGDMQLIEELDFYDWLPEEDTTG